MLRKRAHHRGLTFITGRPQIGKSTLLRQVVHALRTDGGTLVGYHRASGTASALLYAAADLYESLIPNLKWRDEFRLIVGTRRGRLPPRVLAAIGSILAEGTPDPIKAAFQRALDALVSTDSDVQSGGGRTSLERMAIDEVKALLELASLASHCSSMTLVLDQWEDSRDIEHEAGILRTFITELASWPIDLHVLIHIRNPAYASSDVGAAQAISHATDFERRSGAVTTHQLSPIDFTRDGLARTDLIQWLHQVFPFTNTVPADDIVDMVDGNPGVLRRWLENPPEDAKSLRATAVLAHAYHYPELRNELDRARDEWSAGDGEDALLDVAIRLVLVAPALDETVWKSVGHCVVPNRHLTLIDQLEERSLISRTPEFPSLGLPKRLEAAHHLVTTDVKLRPHALRALKVLVERLSTSFTSLEDQASAMAAFVLITLKAAATELRADDATMLVILAARTLAGERLSKNNLSAFLSLLDRSNTPIAAGTARVIALAVFNSFNESGPNGDGHQQAVLLRHLERLCGAHPSDSLIRREYARGLFNAIVFAREDADWNRLEGLLGQLRAFHERHPSDQGVRGAFAKALSTATLALKGAGLASRAATLPGELAQLQASFPEEPEVREAAAADIFNEMNAAKATGDLHERNRLLDSLRAFSERYPNDSAVRARLASGILNKLIDARSEGDPDRGSALLDELRNIARVHHSEPPLFATLARGIVTSLTHDLQEHDLGRMNDLLQELRSLVTTQPRESELPVVLAQGLFNALIGMQEVADLEQYHSLLSELRHLCISHPQAPGIRLELAKALCNSIGAPPASDAIDRQDILIEEMESLLERYPTDTDIVEPVARGILSAIGRCRNTKALDRAHLLLDRLRALSRATPLNAGVQRQLAKGIAHCTHPTMLDERPDEHAALLNELLRMRQAWPSDDDVVMSLARGLFNKLGTIKEDHDFLRRMTVIEELGTLSRECPTNANVRAEYAMGLCDTLIDTLNESAPAQHTAILTLLRRLAADHATETAVMDSLGKGLAATIVSQTAPPEHTIAAALLDELRHLHRRSPEDKPARGRLARCLTHALVAAVNGKTTDTPALLLEELRTYHVQWPHDSAILVGLIMGIASMLLGTKPSEDTPHQAEYRTELAAKLKHALTIVKEDPDPALIAMLELLVKEESG